MKLDDLFQGIPFLEKLHWKSSAHITHITSDSRLVTPGTLFVACRGSRMDAHDFIGQALLAGASAVVCESIPDFSFLKPVPVARVPSSRNALSLLLQRFYHFPDERLKLIGVTGTNGKTTIAYLLYRLLREKTGSAYLGTLDYEWPGHRLQSVNTTPGPELLIPILAQMRQDGVRYGVMEVSSHALDQGRVYGLPFELAIFTQLTQDHFDYHRTMERYFQAKRLLFSAVPSPKHTLINRDCVFGRRLLEEFSEAKSFSISQAADFEARSLESDFSGTRFVFKNTSGSSPCRIPMPFKHNVANAVAVLGALELLGFDPAEFFQELAAFEGIPGRLERVSKDEPFSVFVDYAHTPDAFENVLGQAARLKPRRIFTLFGCGGDRDPGKRKLMTEAACRFSDAVVLTSDNPRSEDPDKIIADMKEGIPSSGKRPEVFEVPDRRQAIEKLISLAGEGDVLFILGKGHEDYQILGDKKVPFDDRLVARECLQQRSRVLS